MSMTTRTSIFDPSEYLEDEEAIAGYLDAILELNDPAVLQAALGDIARARDYNEISTFCHAYPEAIFITKNGQGDLAVMSIEVYEGLVARQQLSALLDEGMQDIREGRCQPYQEAMSELRAGLADGTL
jgi:probable addiction module antidote protein